MSLNRFSEAPALYDRALRLFEQSPGLHAAGIVSALTNRAVLAVRNGKAPDAVLDLNRAIETYEKAVGQHHPDLLRPLVNLARVYVILDRPAFAAVPIRRATYIAETALGRNHPILGEILATYAVVLKKTGKRRESREMERRSQAIYAEYPRNRPNTTVHISDLLRPERSR
jgi:tetratricopeptide (TPR) repeat protein